MCGPMARPTRVSGKPTRCMGKDSFTGEMENGTKDTSRMICVMVKAALNGGMDVCTRAHGAKANNMV